MKGKLALSIIVIFIFAVVLLLLNAGQTEVNRVFTPSELHEYLAERKLAELPRVRLAARVAPAEIKYQVEPEIILDFLAEDPPKKTSTAQKVDSQHPLRIVYYGIKPDMFAVGRDVIVDGEYRSGTFFASTLLTQCPSKYEPPKPQE